jgi:F-type H+-transporting ATPase subunit b
MEETSILSNTTFWYAVAVGLFVVVALVKIRGPILGWLDGEIARVRAELDEAKKLREEAAATLADYRNRQQEAVEEAERIVAEARADAAKLRVEAEANLKETLERQEQIFLDRVKLAHTEAIDEVRNFVIDEVLIEAKGKLKKMADQPEAVALLDRIISDLPKLTKNKVA